MHVVGTERDDYDEAYVRTTAWIEYLVESPILIPIHRRRRRR
jgi:hypothetical protein